MRLIVSGLQQESRSKWNSLIGWCLTWLRSDETYYIVILFSYCRQIVSEFTVIFVLTYSYLLSNFTVVTEQ